MWCQKGDDGRSSAEPGASRVCLGIVVPAAPLPEPLFPDAAARFVEASPGSRMDRS
jgi:hypothetical protein